MQRRARLAAVVVALSIMGLAGCGEAGPVTTGSLPAGTTVKPEQYLADARETAAATTEFAAIVNALPKPLTAEALRSAAKLMTAPLERIVAAGGRLSAMRLEDQRLEAQRVRVDGAVTDVVASMTRLRAAAAAADLAATKARAADLQTAIAALRATSAGAG